MIVRAAAPMRVSFAGGSTDVPEYFNERGGAVINTTIDVFAYATVVERDDDVIRLIMEDVGYQEEARLGQLRAEGPARLLKGVLMQYDLRSGLEVRTLSQAPPGSGLGGSSALAVALIGAVSSLLGLDVDPERVARTAVYVERHFLGDPGGYQDQYAAAYGGLNFMEFTRDGVKVTPIRPPEWVLEELQYRLLMFFTGSTHDSGAIHRDLKDRMKSREEVLQALDNIKRAAYGIRDALMKGDLEAFGELLHEEWVNKRATSPSVSTPFIDSAYERARRAGALGGKLLGAGGGGFLLLFVRPERRVDVVKEMASLGLQEYRFRFEPKGLRTWRVGARGEGK